MFQYASDLHIDEWPENTPIETFLVPSAPFLILAGDICPVLNKRYFEFLNWTSRLWHTVFIVAGNHEYHNIDGCTINAIDNFIYDFCMKYSNLVFLQNGACYYCYNLNTRLIGATLWSDPDPKMWSAAVDKKGDYKKIFVDHGNRKLLPSDVRDLHTVHKKSLESAIGRAANMNENIIVVTHYMPTKRLLEPEYRDEAWHTFYASNDDDMFIQNIKMWICGHGHRATKLKISRGPLLLMNARGYNRTEEINRTLDIYDPCALAKLNINTHYY